MARRNSETGRLAVIWLATAFVVVIGAAASAFVIFAATDKRQFPLVIWGIALGGLVIALISHSLRWDQPIGRLQTWLLAQNRSDPTDEYRAARRSIRLREQLGNNEPPSVESVREAANQGGAWVPRSSASPRSSPKRSSR